MATNTGRFVWYEDLAKDPKAAIDFYSDVVGWKTQPFEGNTDYVMWVGSQGPLGGVMKLPDEVAKMGAPPHWMAHVEVENVDATAAQAKKLGGKVHKERRRYSHSRPLCRLDLPRAPTPSSHRAIPWSSPTTSKESLNSIARTPISDDRRAKYFKRIMWAFGPLPALGWRRFGRTGIIWMRPTIGSPEVLSAEMSFKKRPKKRRGSTCGRTLTDAIGPWSCGAQERLLHLAR